MDNSDQVECSQDQIVSFVKAKGNVSMPVGPDDRRYSFEPRSFMLDRGQFFICLSGQLEYYTRWGNSCRWPESPSIPFSTYLTQFPSRQRRQTTSKTYLIRHRDWPSIIHFDAASIHSSIRTIYNIYYHISVLLHRARQWTFRRYNRVTIVS